jgi:FkbM family methyltransferase
VAPGSVTVGAFEPTDHPCAQHTHPTLRTPAYHIAPDPQLCHGEPDLCRRFRRETNRDTSIPDGSPPTQLLDVFKLAKGTSQIGSRRGSGSPSSGVANRWYNPPVRAELYDRQGRVSKVRIVTFLHVARRFAQSRGLDVSRFPGDHPMHQVVQLLRHHRITRVLDVGANDGGYATELRRFGFTGRIVSFEPVSEPFRLLGKHARHDADWMTLHCAIGAESAKVTINVAANNAASSSVLPMLATHEEAAPGAMIVGAETVTQNALDGLWPDITEPDDRVFLKVDVQGYERQVLDGVAEHLDRVTGLQLELSMLPLYEGGWLYDEALDWASRHGFALMRLIPGFTDERTGQMMQADGVFFRS